MLDKILKASLSARAAVLVFAALLLAGGVLTLLRTEVDIFPDLNAPTVVVMTEAPGLSPEEVERAVSFPLETALNGAGSVRRVTSSSQTGFSVVKAEFDWGVDIYQARQTVSERIAPVAATMPRGVGAPTLGPQSSILGEVMIIGLTSDSLPAARVRSVADRLIRPRLLALEGVAQVAVMGGDVAEYRILLDPARMKARGVSLSQVREAAEGMNSNAAGAVINEYGNEYLVQADLSTSSPELLSQALVGLDAAGMPVTIADVATVTTGARHPRPGAASVEGKSAVLLTLTKQPGAGTLETTGRIDRELQALSAALPAGLEVHTAIFRQADFIDAAIGSLRSSLLEGALFVTIVLFFFLMNMRATLVSLVALPLSILITVMTLHLLGFTINTMSLGGIAIAIGALVDDAIVDVENVYKRLRRNRALPAGERRAVTAVVYEASREVRMPIFNSTLVIVAGFLPLFFLSGLEGRMMMPLGVAFVVALFASTAVALTVTPVLCCYLLGSARQDALLSREPRAMAWLRERYGKSLGKALAGRRKWLMATGALFLTALGAFFTLGRSFLPSFNEGSFTITLTTVPGVALEESDRLGREAERLLLTVPEVTTVARKTGRAELDEHSFGVNVSELEVPYTLRGRSRAELAAELRELLSVLPGVNVEVGQPVSHRIDAMLSGSKQQIAVKVFGPDIERLYAIGSRIKAAAGEVPGLVDVNLEQLTMRPRLSIKPRRELLARYGVTLPAFADAVRVALAGEVVGQVYEDGVPYDLTLRLDPSAAAGIDAVRDLMIDTPAGPVPLAQLADVRTDITPAAVNRENVARRIIVSANVEGRDLAGAVEALRSAVDEQVDLPEGYHLEYGGQFENQARASRTLALTSLLAILVIFLLLYKEFRSTGQALIIMLNMPLAAIGGVLILRLTTGELNIPAIIGFISLIGITTRNGMLLMTRYNALARTGKSLRARIMEGSADRLAPIVMTSLTSALALVPLALRGAQPGAELQSPMAVVILGGLLSSTVLNIFIVPIAYYLYTRRQTPNLPTDEETAEENAEENAE